jgi:hypothetical protein
LPCAIWCPWMVIPVLHTSALLQILWLPLGRYYRPGISILLCISFSQTKHGKQDKQRQEKKTVKKSRFPAFGYPLHVPRSLRYLLLLHTPDCAAPTGSTTEKAKKEIIINYLQPAIGARDSQPITRRPFLGGDPFPFLFCCCCWPSCMWRSLIGRERKGHSLIIFSYIQSPWGSFSARRT